MGVESVYESKISEPARPGPTVTLFDGLYLTIGYT